MNALAIIILACAGLAEAIGVGYYLLGGHPVPKRPVPLSLFSSTLEIAAVLLALQVL